MTCAQFVRSVALAGALSAAAVSLAQPVIDGMNIPSEFPAPLAVQRFATGFGDHNTTSQFGSGAELDALYVTNDGTNLYIGLTGNLENNGNGCLVFIDTNPNPSSVYTLFTIDIFSGDPVPGLPRILAGDNLFGGPGFDDVTFDVGFAPDYCLSWSGGSPLGSQTRSYYLLNLTALDPVSGGLAHTNTVLGLMTAGDPTASGATPGTLSNFFPGSVPGGALAAADNSNVDGVEGTAAPCPPAVNDPLTATKGFEFAIPLSTLNIGANDEICILAIVSGDNGFISNHFLPTDLTAPDMGYLGNTRPFDFASLGGNQYVCYTIVP